MARIPQALRRAVLAVAQDCCAYCLSPEPMMGVAFEIDHILPSSAGGRTQFDNLCMSCPTCNRHKAKRLAARDPLSGRVVALFHPHRDVWSQHFAWSADSLVHGTRSTWLSFLYGGCWLVRGSTQPPKLLTPVLSVPLTVDSAESVLSKAKAAGFAMCLPRIPSPSLRATGSLRKLGKSDTLARLRKRKNRGRDGHC